MNEPEQHSTSSRRIYIGLAVGLAIGIALNIAPYFLFATPSAEDAAKFHLPQLHKLGFPRAFWVENRSAPPSFYWGAFFFDAVATLGIGIAVAQWFNSRSKSVGAVGEQSALTETPK